jgi:predicted GIY-YIG superfamily endonuclease
LADGLDTNAGSGEIDTVADKIFEISDSSLPSATARDVSNSLTVLNPSPLVGGNDALDIEEIRQLIPAMFASQSRLVNPPDFIVRALSMPAKYGSVFRANAKLNPLNKNSVELIVLAMDANGYVVQAEDQLTANLKKYLGRFRMMTDAIEIMKGDIINLALDFSVLTNPDYNKNEVLANCIDALKDFFDTKKFQLNQPINFTDLAVLLAEIPGVISVIDLKFINRIGVVDGLEYSRTPYNVSQNFKNGILYCQENAIFEIKYKNKDIRRRCKIMINVIYKCICPNGKLYIGQASNFKKRMNAHKKSYMNVNCLDYNSIFHRAIRKYGFENIKWEIIMDNLPTKQHLDMWERLWIFIEDATNPSLGYNILPGGSGVSARKYSLE